jgi:hypothetical protein
VLFSAAIPYQGRLAHVNEQSQSYWADFVGQHDYLAIDAIRPAVWSDERVDPRYARSAVLYVPGEAIDERFGGVKLARCPA